MQYVTTQARNAVNSVIATRKHLKARLRTSRSIGNGATVTLKSIKPRPRLTTLSAMESLNDKHVRFVGRRRKLIMTITQNRLMFAGFAQSITWKDTGSMPS